MTLLHPCSVAVTDGDSLHGGQMQRPMRSARATSTPLSLDCSLSHQRLTSSHALLRSSSPALSRAPTLINQLAVTVARTSGCWQAARPSFSLSAWPRLPRIKRAPASCAIRIMRTTRPRCVCSPERGRQHSLTRTAGRGDAHSAGQHTAPRQLTRRRQQPPSSSAALIAAEPRSILLLSQRGQAVVMLLRSQVTTTVSTGPTKLQQGTPATSVRAAGKLARFALLCPCCLPAHWPFVGG